MWTEVRINPSAMNLPERGQGARIVGPAARESFVVTKHSLGAIDATKTGIGEPIPVIDVVVRNWKPRFVEPSQIEKEGARSE